MRIHSTERCPRDARHRFATGLLGFASIFLASLTSRAQTINTVQQNEFRSRWADYQADRPPDTGTGSGTAEQELGISGPLSKQLYELLHTGHLQFKASFATGWEYSDEATLEQQDPRGTHDSFFVAPALGLSYDRDLGAVTVSARYSIGYIYYLDQSYIAANHKGGILSQTAALDLKAEGTRADFSSSASASYGDGNDIESGTQRTQLSLSETAKAGYLLTAFTRLGANAGVSYTTYTGGGVTDIRTLDDTASVYIEYAYSPKTVTRFELAAGQEYQEGSGATGIGGVNSGDRWYYQALVSADYLVTGKFTLSVGVGYGVQNDSTVLGEGRSGSHPIYRIKVQYVPTEKTTVSLRFGYEGVDVKPSLALDVKCQFRLTTSATLSIYQASNFSTYEVAQSLVTRGVLAAAQQRLFGRVDLVLSGGVEQSAGYGSLTSTQPAANEKPYYFASLSLAWQLNSYLSFQTYYRGYTGESGVVTTSGQLQSRAAVSFRLTF